MSAKRIMIIDDNETFVDVLTECLEYYHFIVRVHNDTVAIAEDIKMFNPDVLLLDYMLPGETGESILHQLRTSADTERLFVIMVSAYFRREEKFSEADALLNKPFDLDELVQIINGLLPGRSCCCKTGSIEQDGPSLAD